MSERRWLSWRGARKTARSAVELDINNNDYYSGRHYFCTLGGKTPTRLRAGFPYL